MNSENLSYFVSRGETLTLNETVRKDLRGSFIRLSNGVTHYELTGPSDGALVMLVPSLTVPLFYWDQLAQRLHGMGLRTLAYSAYGRGYSDRVVSQYGPALFVGQAQELLSKLGITDVTHVLSSSMGSLISMALLQQPWFRAQTLTLIGPAGLASQLPLIARLAKYKGLAQVLGRLMGARGVVQHLDKNVRTAAQAFLIKQMVGEAFRYEGSIYALLSTLRAFPLIHQQALYRQTGQLRIPTLLLWGDEDHITPTREISEAKLLLQPVDAQLINRCGHMAPFECPDEVAQIFGDFLKKCQVSPR